MQKPTEQEIREAAELTASIFLPLLIAAFVVGLVVGYATWGL